MTNATPTIITGSNGFVGRVLMARIDGPIESLHFARDDWREQVTRVDMRGATVFHLAARVHDDGASAHAFVLDNIEKTRVLALAAREAGARRFVFLSTIKVNGEETEDRPFTASDPPKPQDAYGRSKWGAEQVLASIEGLDSAIVRSPLVYGAGAKGNLRSLLRLADMPWPLPLGGIRNRRSFIHVDDLARLLLTCSTHPQAIGKTFVTAHRDPVSTSELVSEMRRSLGRSSRLFALPKGALEFAAATAGAGEKMRRMTRSLEIDCDETQRLLGWTAEIALRPAIEDMVRAYRESQP